MRRDLAQRLGLVPGGVHAPEQRLGVNDGSPALGSVTAADYRTHTALVWICPGEQRFRRNPSPRRSAAVAGLSASFLLQPTHRPQTKFELGFVCSQWNLSLIWRSFHSNSIWGNFVNNSVWWGERGWTEPSLRLARCAVVKALTFSEAQRKGSL